MQIHKLQKEEGYDKRENEKESTKRKKKRSTAMQRAKDGWTRSES